MLKSRFSQADIPLAPDFQNPVWMEAGWKPISTQWNGNPVDQQWTTRFASRWTASHLYFAFDCRFLQMTAAQVPQRAAKTHHLWDLEDVVEIFLSPEIAQLECYREFELSPSGQWIDIDIDHTSGRTDFEWQSGMAGCSQVDQNQRSWKAVMQIPLRAFEPTAIQTGLTVGLNAYRVELKSNLYLAWNPTLTSKPDFHVPRRFGRMVFTN
ncbi:MAG: carbohydrate-binding family 9-like protein [Acidobacteriia bacterium]|nr:carbohydrate-binding family 9-like protein [Terriglobia bacterium]